CDLLLVPDSSLKEHPKLKGCRFPPSCGGLIRYLSPKYPSMVGQLKFFFLFDPVKEKETGPW
ncbi:MAG: hypothetical protein M3Y08_17525, partial [Fibrobacterota bacterium]|nr:hypothetical protein [Fibrobacterota bacterium]